MTMKIIKKIDYNKDLNSRCFCGKGLNWIEEDLIMLEPCEHMIHKSCKTEVNNICPYCHQKIKIFYTEGQLRAKKKDPYYYQKYVDLISVRHCNYMSKINKRKIIEKIPKIISLASKIPFYEGKEGAIKLANDLLNIAHVELQVEGIENIPKDPKVIIANHTTDYDFVPLYYIFRCSFLSSTIILQSSMGRVLTRLANVIIVNRGHKEQYTVKRMRNAVKKYGSICVFPEGLLTHPDTIIKFRSGAFNIGYQICPVVITYEPNVFDSDMINYVQKVISQDKFKVKLTILPVEQPPFTQDRIEEIRAKMGKAGNMALSRTINRDIRDDY
jgi:1-acyl-sn-glycerol-3-phosphate acyltransferase